jgi:mRNA-degrading endonuclease RelE of RelBE toxin-antitoxin system
MKFIETSVFTSDAQDLLSDEDYRGLQLALLLRPEQGRVIPGSGGLRKIRWKAKGKGKRGGIRVIYYWITAEDTIFMLLAYEKLAQDDLTPAQAKVLRRIVREELE